MSDSKSNQDRPAEGVTLSPADAAAIDQLLAAGSNAALEELIAAEARASSDPARLQRVGEWLQTLATLPAAPPPADLVSRTLAAAQQEPANFQAEEEPVVVRRSVFSRRFAEYAALAVAASVLIAVLIPGLSQARATSRRYACAQNLGAVGRAFEQYGTTFSGELPSLAMPADGDFRVRDLSLASETNHSNAANLIPLIRGKFVKLENLACPGRTVANIPAWTASMNELPDALRGYSYTSLMGATRPRWDKSAATIVMADRNPLFCPAGCTDPASNSLNHGQSGNYVLRTNGAVDWDRSPNVGPNRDNIWTVSYKQNPVAQAYDGTEAPLAAGDVFLSP